MIKKKVGELRALIFDLDDTLYPERTYVISGFRAVAAWAEEHIGIPQKQAFDELCQLFESGIRGNTFNYWLEKHGFNPDRWVSQMVQVSVSYTHLTLPTTERV